MRLRQIHSLLAPRVAFAAGRGADLVATAGANSSSVGSKPGDHAASAPGRYMASEGDVMDTITLVSCDVILDELTLEGL
jgi:hypothetical protein